MIRDYRNKKLAEYLEPNQKVLIRFGHGLGDTIMFIPALEKLRSEYPKTQIDLYVESGQEEIFESAKDMNDPSYDYIFHLDFPMCEGSNITKVEKCCKEELGINVPKKEFADLPDKESPLVAVHFHGTALPKSVGCPEDVAKKIWFEIIQAGKIPIECHFRHMFHNPVNILFDAVNRHVRDIPADLHKLIGLIQHCYAFIGVASGPFVVAMSVMPERMMYLEKQHPLKNYTKRKDLASVNVLKYKEGSVYEWLVNMQ